MEINDNNKIYNAEEAVFYITNVCNLTCRNCESFNNKIFKGYSCWEDHENDYKKWSRLLSINLLNIHGGEPFTNKDLYNWAYNLKKLWPDCKEYTISTNGTLLKRNIELSRKLLKLGYCLEVSVHDPKQYEYIEETVRTILSKCNYFVLKRSFEKTYKCKNFDHELIRISEDYYFNKSPAQYQKNGVIYMHRSDPERSHKMCDAGCDGSFIVLNQGKVFKCFLTSIAKDLINQFQIEKEAENILKQYKHADPNDDLETLKRFFSNVHNPIKQCTLCPENPMRFPIYPLIDKKTND